MRTICAWFQKSKRFCADDACTSLGVSSGTTVHEYNGGGMSDTAEGAYNNYMREALGHEYSYSNAFGSFHVYSHGGVQTRISQVDPVVFVGGAGDKNKSQIVQSMATLFTQLNPNIPTRYFSWAETNSILKYLRSVGNAPITLIGHSYGADTAAKIAANALQTLGRTINLLVTVDPVGRTGVSTSLFEKIAVATDRWVNITSNPARQNFSDTIASFGGRWPSEVSRYADQSFSVNANHENFSDLLNSACGNFMAGGGC